MEYPIALPLSSVGKDSLATLSHPSPEVWELEMHNGHDNRLTTHFLWTCLLKALDLVEKDWRSTPGAPGALIISGKRDQQKFFSNGKCLELHLPHTTVENKVALSQDLTMRMFQKTHPLPRVSAIPLSR